MALYRNGSFGDDDWQFPGETEPVPATGKVALAKARLIAEWPKLRQRNAGAGVVLAAGERLDGLQEIIPHLRLVVVHVAKYADGRHFSTARLLRDRFGYQGELRAVGDVLQDQIVFLTRVGFDALDVTHPGTIGALREGRIKAVRHHYQPASREGTETRPGPRPWLRVSETV
ncbi:DUF934 domain-containing protein [Blastochloris tepida]|uniref:Oxidoreductase n=1 Tax=Blastochloris tepida TaxID=2233851 RepID=A0A348G1L8_9HYPH|nr:DUF934 domain-containing protein [Blastochloris tepida]BBF93451.1 oxidoreductase [Blastochloris tepida]